MDPIVGSLLAFAIVFCLGYVIQQQLIRRVLKAPEVAQIFLTVGILIVVENLALIFFGSEYKSVQTWYQSESLEFLGLIISMPYGIAFCASVLAGLVI